MMDKGIMQPVLDIPALLAQSGQATHYSGIASPAHDRESRSVEEQHI